MQTRALAVRVILGIAALTTVATSLPELSMEDSIEGAIGAGPSRIRVIASEAAVAEGDELILVVEFRTPTGTTAFQVTAIADDSDTNIRSATADEAGNSFYFDLMYLCPSEGDCDAGVTFEVPEGRTLEVTATASLVKRGGGGCISGDPPPFSPEARVEVELP
jgi:hypothetical protein